MVDEEKEEEEEETALHKELQTKQTRDLTFLKATTSKPSILECHITLFSSHASLIITPYHQ